MKVISLISPKIIFVPTIIHRALKNVTYRVCSYIAGSYKAWPYKMCNSNIISICGYNQAMEENPLILFGLRLRELRKIKGISQERLALESGIGRSYLGEVERGKRNIALLNIYKLAKALNIEPSQLLEKPELDQKQ